MSDTSTARLAPPPEGPEGIGGWLLLPVFHLLLDVFWFGWLIFVSINAAGAPETAAPAVAADVSLDMKTYASLGYILFDFLVLIYAVYCLVRLFQKREEVPGLMMGFYLLVIAKAVGNAILLDVFPDLQDTPR